MRFLLPVTLFLFFARTLGGAEKVEPLQTLSGHVGKINAVAFSPNGKYLASAGADKSVCLWDTASGQLLHTFVGHEGNITSVAFRPDSYLLASAGAKGEAGEVLIWNCGNGKFFRRHDFPTQVTHVGYGPKNAFAAACQNGSVYHRYTCTGNTIVERKLATEQLCFIGFRADQTLIAAAGGHQPKLWNVTTGEGIAEYSSHSFAASHGVLSPDGMTLATVGVNQLKLWDVKTGKLQSTPQGIHGHSSAIAFTSDGKTLVTGGSNCHSRPDNEQQRVEFNLWDVGTGERKAFFPGELPVILSLAISPDGQVIATGSAHGKISLWSVNGARPIVNLNR